MNQRKRKISQLKKNCLEKNKKESGTIERINKEKKKEWKNYNTKNKKLEKKSN